MQKQETKQKILQTGALLIHSKGFNNTGLQEILTSAGVPKGSFYFYFKNKEEFGLNLIDFYMGFIRKILEKHLNDKEKPPLERLKGFFVYFRKVFENDDCRYGCPVGNLSQEMSGLNEFFREKLVGAYSSVKSAIKELLEEAKENGELAPDLDLEELAGFLFNSWEGAIIEMKLTRSSKPLLIFENTIFNTFLRVLV
ncbi:MAG: TetR family transcriptional regulator [bacterium]|nr:TetR family transcriptional regulator [bacterium]